MHKLFVADAFTESANCRNESLAERFNWFVAVNLLLTVEIFYFADFTLD